MRRALFLVALLLAHCALLSVPARAVAQELESERHMMVPQAARQEVFGELRLLSALRLSMPGVEAFGGFSGLWVSEDRTKMIAISDQAQWFTFRLDSAPDGSLRGLDLLEHGPLLDLEGLPLEGRERVDAESLTRLADGSFLIAFEREHRIWRYDSLSGLPRPFPMPQGHRPGSNQGLEGIERLADGRLVAFSEGLTSDESSGESSKNWRAWLYEDAVWRPFTYKRTRALQPTGAGLLPDGDVILVERFFSTIGGLHIRLARIAASDLQPGAVIESQELATFHEPPQNIDNFEAIAARQGPGGQTLIYLLADDNFNAPLQDTLLLVFLLRP